MLGDTVCVRVRVCVCACGWVAGYSRCGRGWVSITGDGPTDRREGYNGPLTGLEREENAPTVVSRNIRFLASRSVC